MTLARPTPTAEKSKNCRSTVPEEKTIGGHISDDDDGGDKTEEEQDVSWRRVPRNRNFGKNSTEGRCPGPAHMAHERTEKEREQRERNNVIKGARSAKNEPQRMARAHLARHTRCSESVGPEAGELITPYPLLIC